MTDFSQALPDRPVTPEPAPGIDEDGSGSVSIEGLSLENSPPKPAIAAATVASKQPLAAPPPKPTPAPPVLAVTAVPTDLTEANTDRRFVWIEEAASSWNPNPMAQPTTTSGLKVGDLAPVHYHFGSIQALSKYPYKWCNKAQMQEIASASFDNNKFWERAWDL